MIIPLAVLTVYFLALAAFLSWLLPEYPRNVNAVFLARVGRYSLLLTIALALIFLALIRTGVGAKPVLRGGREKLSAGDLSLILLPLVPVVGYISNNQDILSLSGSLYVLGVFTGFSLFFIVLVPLLLGAVGSLRTLMMMGAAFTFMITGMASLSARYRWLEEGSLRVQSAVFVAIFLAGWLLYRWPSGRKLARVVVVSFFLINGLTGLAFRDGADRAVSEVAENRLAELIGSRTPPVTPDIYLLVYDAYVANETMLGYGIDNSAQEKYLESLVFTLYPRLYSICPCSITTMSRTLNASEHYYGSSRRGVSGDGIVLNLLKGFGYDTYGIFKSDYFFRGIGSSYDSSFPGPKGTGQLLVKAIFMGEFRFDVEFDRPSDRQFEDRKRSVFEMDSGNPRLVYVHTPLPGHSQDSGDCRPDETELFREKLAEANLRMTRDIEMIIRNDPGAIIVVSGDHGPYLTKNCTATGGRYDISEISRLDIQDRYGTFLAIRCPSGEFSKYGDITVHQDLFIAVFAYLFRDRRLLEARVAAETLYPRIVSGASVKNGIIRGGINDGEPLFAGP